MIKVGICGGTFNPIHNAHLIIAQEAKEEFNLDKVIFIPSGNPPHKKEIGTKDNIQRLNMVKRAVEDNNSFDVLDMEIKRDGYTYTIDTLTEIKNLYKDYELYYIIGADVVLDLCNWKDHRKVFEICNFISFLRPGFDEKILLAETNRLILRYNIRIKFLVNILFDISSTMIRERIKNKRSIKYLVPQRVEEYIRENDLYQ